MLGGSQYAISIKENSKQLITALSIVIDPKSLCSAYISHVFVNIIREIDNKVLISGGECVQFQVLVAPPGP